MGHRIGGGFVVTPLRTELMTDGPIRQFETRGWHFKQVFMPAGRPVEQRAPEPVSEPEEPAADEPVVATS
jgi:hypothetical protein